MELIAYGKVVKPHGLSGEVKVLPFSGEFSSFKNFINLYISLEKNNPPKFIISRSRNQKNYIIVKLEGIDSIDDASLLIKRNSPSKKKMNTTGLS
jgi:16S rRNA processing protein RimM